MEKVCAARSLRPRRSPRSEPGRSLRWPSSTRKSVRRTGRVPSWAAVYNQIEFQVHENECCKSVETTDATIVYFTDHGLLSALLGHNHDWSHLFVAGRPPP